MNPFLLILSGLLMPVLLLITLVGPVYLSVVAALMIIYQDHSSAILDAAGSLSYIYQAYGQAFGYWLEHYEKVDHLYYSTPLLLLPLIGVALSAYITYRFGRWSASGFRANIL